MTQFNTTVEDGIMVMTMQGDLIGETSGMQILEKVNQRLYEGVKYAIVNLEDVRYVNSSGLGVLITMLNTYTKEGGDIVLVNPSDHVQKLLVMTKLQTLFKTESSVSSAKEKLKNP